MFVYNIYFITIKTQTIENEWKTPSKAIWRLHGATVKLNLEATDQQVCSVL